MSSQWSLILQLLPIEFLNTLYMVFVSFFFSVLLGTPLGVILWLTGTRGFYPHSFLYGIANAIVNIGRSIPFAILIIAIFPFTRWVVGTSIGTTASIVPLTLAATPFVARLFESALEGVDRHLVEAAQVMGAKVHQILLTLLLPEALPQLLRAGTLTLVNLVSYSALAGLVGGGGLGKVAIQYGYQRFNGFVMGWTLLVLLLLVEGIQFFGNNLVKCVLKKRGLA